MWILFGILGLALLGGHVAGLRVAYPQLFSPREWQSRRQHTRWSLATVERLLSAGQTAVYTHDPDVLTFASGERITPVDVDLRTEEGSIRGVAGSQMAAA